MHFVRISFKTCLGILSVHLIVLLPSSLAFKSTIIDTKEHLAEVGGSTDCEYVEIGESNSYCEIHDYWKPNSSSIERTCNISVKLEKVVELDVNSVNLRLRLMGNISSSYSSIRVMYIEIPGQEARNLTPLLFDLNCDWSVHFYLNDDINEVLNPDTEIIFKLNYQSASVVVLDKIEFIAQQDPSATISSEKFDKSSIDMSFLETTSVETLDPTITTTTTVTRVTSELPTSTSDQTSEIISEPSSVATIETISFDTSNPTTVTFASSSSNPTTDAAFDPSISNPTTDTTFDPSSSNPITDTTFEPSSTETTAITTFGTSNPTTDITFESSSIGTTDATTYESSNPTRETTFDPSPSNPTTDTTFEPSSIGTSEITTFGTSNPTTDITFESSSIGTTDGTTYKSSNPTRETTFDPSSSNPTTDTTFEPSSIGTSEITTFGTSNPTTDITFESSSIGTTDGTTYKSSNPTRDTTFDPSSSNPTTDTTFEPSSIGTSEITTFGTSNPTTDITFESSSIGTTEGTTYKSSNPTRETTFDPSSSNPTTDTTFEPSSIGTSEITTFGTSNPTTDITFESSSIGTTEGTTYKSSNPTRETTFDPSSSNPTTDTTFEPSSIGTSEITTFGTSNPTTDITFESSSIGTTEGTTYKSSNPTRETTFDPSSSNPTTDTTFEPSSIGTSEITTFGTSNPATDITFESSSIRTTDATTFETSNPTGETVFDPSSSNPITETTFDPGSSISTIDTTFEPSSTETTEITTFGTSNPTIDTTFESSSIGTTDATTFETSNPTLETTLRFSSFKTTDTTTFETSPFESSTHAEEPEEPSTIPPPPGDCSLGSCSAVVENYGETWEACEGSTAVRDCPNNSSGKATWVCRGGKFQGITPSYTNCKTGWIDDVNKTIEEGIPLNQTGAGDLIQLIASRSRDQAYFGHEIGALLDLSSRILSLVEEDVELVEYEYLTESAWDIFGNVMSTREQWEELSADHRSQIGTTFIFSLEQTGLELSRRAALQRASSFDAEPSYLRTLDKFSEFDFAAGVQLRTGAPPEFPHNYSFYDSHMQLPDDWGRYFSGEKVTFVGVGTRGDTSQYIFPGYMNNLGSESNETGPKILNSDILGFTFGEDDSAEQLRFNNLWNNEDFVFDSTPNQNEAKDINFTGDGVKIHLHHTTLASRSKSINLNRRKHPGEIARPVLGSTACVYWDTSKLEWSSEGCKLVETKRSVTTCECSHLTSFAVLMDIHNFVGKESGLEILTLIICPISIICLIAAILIFATVRATHGARTSITKQLSISLLIGNLLIITVVDRHYLYLSDEMCTAFAILVHYVFLTAFMFMAIQGHHLYQQIVHVFESATTNMTIYRVTAYGVPVLIVGATAIVDAIVDSPVYGGEMFCWLQGEYIWAFMVPVAVICGGNILVLIVTLRAAHRVHSPSAYITHRVRSYKTLINGSLSLTILLGLTWLTGFFMLTDSLSSIIAAYLFTVLNGSQGIFILVFHCLLNENVRLNVRRKFTSRSAWLSSRRGRTEFTNMPSSN